MGLVCGEGGEEGRVGVRCVSWVRVVQCGWAFWYVDGLACWFAGLANYLFSYPTFLLQNCTRAIMLAPLFFDCVLCLFAVPRIFL